MQSKNAKVTQPTTVNTTPSLEVISSNQTSTHSKSSVFQYKKMNIIEEIILADSGKHIMEYFSLNEKLDKLNRDDLISSIVEKQLFQIADDICRIFPTEEKVICLIFK